MDSAETDISSDRAGRDVGTRVDQAGADVDASGRNCPLWSAGAAVTSPDLRKCAVVNGPDGADLPFPAGPKECTRPDESFDGQGSRHADDLSSRPSNEPVIDFASTAPLAFSLAGRS